MGLGEKRKLKLNQQQGQKNIRPIHFYGQALFINNVSVFFHFLTIEEVSHLS